MNIPPELIAAYQAIQWQLLALQGVTGVGIGFNERDGEIIEEPALRVHVADLSQVPAGIPETLGAFNVCLVEADIQPCALPDTVRYADVAGGIKVGTAAGSGTLGVVVRDAGSQTQFGLTCFHVIASPGSAPGPVWQPDTPPLVFGVPLPTADMLGDTLRFEFPRTPTPTIIPQLISTIDAAIFKLDIGSLTGRAISRRIVGHAGGASNLTTGVTGVMDETQGPMVGKIVVKRGFVTGLTRGVIIGATHTCPWLPGGSNAHLIDQYEIRALGADSTVPFALKGDSGALVLLEGTSTAVGLLYGATPSGTTCAANKIRNVEFLLGVKVA